MTRALKAELLKLLTTRAIYGLLAGEIGVVLLTTVSTVMSAKSTSLTGPIHNQVFFLLVSINVGLFSLIIGMRTMTDEFRHSTIAHSFLSDPKRRRTIVAKGVTGAVAAASLALLSAAVMVAVALPLASGKGGGLSFSGDDLGATAGFVAAQALWALVGVGIAAIVRHQVPAVVGGVVWILVIENLGSAFLGDAGRYLPGQAAYAFAKALDGAALVPSTAAVVLTFYAAAGMLLGLMVVRRRDVA